MGSVDETQMAEMMARIEELSSQCASASARRLDDHVILAADLDTIWLILGAIGVFSMQSGFAMLEVGTCARDHTKEILLKNIMDIAIGSLSWLVFGYALAHGQDDFTSNGYNGITGTSGFFYQGEADRTDHGKLRGQAFWFFQLSFATTCLGGVRVSFWEARPRVARPSPPVGRRRSCPGRSRSGAKWWRILQRPASSRRSSFR